MTNAIALAKPDISKKTVIAGIAFFIALTALSLLFPQPAQAMPWDDWINDIGNNFEQFIKNIIIGFCNSLLDSAMKFISYFDAKDALDASFNAILTRDNGESQAYKVITGLKSTVVTTGQSILAFALLLQLVKISQRIDGSQTLPVVKEIGLMALYFFAFSYLVNHSFDICGAAYNEINTLISELLKGQDMKVTTALTLGDTNGWDIGTCLAQLIALLIVYFFSLIGSVIAMALIMARAIQLYVMAACSPIPLALLAFEETRQMGIGFCKNFVSVCLAGLIIAVLIVIYPSLISDILQSCATAGDDGKYALGAGAVGTLVPMLALSFMYWFALMKSGSWARDILGG